MTTAIRLEPGTVTSLRQLTAQLRAAQNAGKPALRVDRMPTAAAVQRHADHAVTAAVRQGERYKHEPALVEAVAAVRALHDKARRTNDPALLEVAKMRKYLVEALAAVTDGKANRPTRPGDPTPITGVMPAGLSALLSLNNALVKVQNQGERELGGTLPGRSSVVDLVRMGLDYAKLGHVPAVRAELRAALGTAKSIVQKARRVAPSRVDAAEAIVTEINVGLDHLAGRAARKPSKQRTPAATTTTPPAHPTVAAGDFSTAGLVAELERVWTEIRKLHPDLPPAVFAFASGFEGHRTPHFGWWAAGRWTTGKRAGVGEVKLSAERIKDGGKGILETLLHEAAHALATVRQITDVSRGQYHTKAYKVLAEEVGLNVTFTKSFGWAHTDLTPATATAWKATIARLDRAAADAFRAIVIKPKRPPSVTSIVMRCACKPQRRIRVPLPHTSGPIFCKVCRTEFKS